MKTQLMLSVFAGAVLLSRVSDAQISQEELKKLLDAAQSGVQQGIKDAQDKGTISSDEADKLLKSVREEQEKAEKRYKELEQKKSAPVEWKEFVSEEGRFSALFPGTPTVKHMASESGTRSHEFSTPSIDDEVSVCLTYYEMPRNINRTTESQFLNLFRDQFLQAGALRSEKPISLRGVPGKELIIDTPKIGVSSKVRLYQTKEHFYSLVCIYGPLGAEPPAVSEQFFNSFHLRDSTVTPAGEPKEASPKPGASMPRVIEIEPEKAGAKSSSGTASSAKGTSVSGDSDKTLRELREQIDALEKRLKALDENTSSTNAPTGSSPDETSDAK